MPQGLPAWRAYGDLLQVGQGGAFEPANFTLTGAYTFTAAPTINVASGTAQVWKLAGVQTAILDGNGILALGSGSPTAGNGLFQLPSGTTKASGVCQADCNLYRSAAAMWTSDGGLTALNLTTSAGRITGNVASSDLGAIVLNVSSSNQQVGMTWKDNGTSKWSFYKDTTHDLRFYNQTLNALTLSFATGDATFSSLVVVDGSTAKTIKYTNGTANGAVATTLGSVGPTGSTAGNPQGWIRINIGGTDRYTPFW